MHILLTRPLDDCKELILRFKSLGHKVSHLPVINVDAILYNEPNYNEFKGIIFTSANAIKNLNTSKINKNLKCFCVGSTTEKLARASGFQNVIAADGNVRALKELILQNHDKKDGKILYVSGELISFNLEEDLRKEGYEIIRIINYSVEHNDEIKDDLIEELKKELNVLRKEYKDDYIQE